MNSEISFSSLSNFFPKQKEALEASKRFKFTLYGGSVGSGKSRWLRWATVFWLMEFHGKHKQQGIRAGLFCEDYPALNDRHLSKIKYEFPEWMGKYNEAKHEFTLAPEYGSGVLAFRNLDDVSKYLSSEFAIIGVDEINRNPKPVFDMLRQRLRWPEIRNTKFLAACNPLGEAWVKNIWVKRLFPPEEREQYEFVFVPALPTENPHLPAEYFKSLESLPDRERKAYLEGSWDAFDEGMDEKGYMRLITDRELQASLTGPSEHSGYKILGIDPAAGGDESSIVMKSGSLQEVIFNHKLKDTMDLVGVAADLYRKSKASMIVVDSGGVGRGVFDRLKEMDFPIKGVSFGEKPQNGDMFSNLKAELHWKEREWLLSGGRLISDPGWNEFEIVKYRTRDGRISIQPKEELFRIGLKSPNCVDAAVLTQAVSDTAIRSSRQLKYNNGIFHDKTIEIWNGR